MVKVSAKQIFVAQIAFSARILANPLIPISSRSLFFDSLVAFTANLQELHDQIWREIDDSQSVEYQRYNVEGNVMTWELLDGEIVGVRRTLVDAVQKVIDEVRGR